MGCEPRALRLWSLTLTVGRMQGSPGLQMRTGLGTFPEVPDQELAEASARKPRRLQGGTWPPSGLWPMGSRRRPQCRADSAFRFT